MIHIPETKLHLSGKLISPKVNKLLDEKIKIANKLKIKSAPFAEIIGQITGLELISTDDNCGGYYSLDNKVIALKKCDFDPSEFIMEHKVTKMRLPYVEYQKMVLCHEIGHALQDKVELFDKMETLISSMLRLEWEAESISHKLYNACFGEVPYYWFNAYFKKEDIDYLKQRQSGWLQNDLI